MKGVRTNNTIHALIGTICVLHSIKELCVTTSWSFMLLSDSLQSIIPNGLSNVGLLFENVYIQKT